jgi:anti-anti-sigma factor
VLFAVDRAAVNGRPALKVHGELDVATVPLLAAYVDDELSSGPRSLVIDLTHTAFLDSSGARHLVRTAKRAAESGTALQVVCPRDNAPVRLVIDLLELQRVVPVVESANLTDGEVGS